MSSSKNLELLNELREETTKPEPDTKRLMQLASSISKLDLSFQRFSIDAKTLIHLGRDSIKDHTTALLELVKNSYDADAIDVDVQIFCNSAIPIIRVSDNGFGMTLDQLLNYWLRIGFSSKRQSKISELGRRKTGEKGIGRISTDRLGGMLELITKTEKDGIIGLKINWDEFDIEGKDVFDIDVELTRPSQILIPQKNNVESVTGTEIRITNLRQKWTLTNIESLYNELSALSPPFNEVKDFNVNLENDIAPAFSRKVLTDFYKTAQIDLTVVFDGSSQIFYSIKDKYSEKEIVDTITLEQFYSKIDDDYGELECGPLEIRLLFFLRESSTITGTNFRLNELREFLDNNNGVKIYRDNIAVKPYGFPKAQFGYDWLGLASRKIRNPAGIGRAKDYMISANQVVGAVFISRDQNTQLLDSAAREGLVESDGFFDMKALTLASIQLLETHRVEIYPEVEKAREEKTRTSTNTKAKEIKDELISVKTDLQDLQARIENSNEQPRTNLFLAPIAELIGKVEGVANDAEITILELLNWQRVLNGLATIGISSAVFGHETEGSISQFQGSTLTARRWLTLSTPPNVEKAVPELDKALKHASKVAAWGAYALTRVQKEKRRKRKISILETINHVVTELKPVFEASSISLELDGEKYFATTFQMDVESILINLLTNAYTACGQKPGERRVIVTIRREDRDRKGFSFTVGDTGPGIAKQFEKRIFEPLFSTKNIPNAESNSAGTGLGLTIVKSIVEELQGTVSFSKDELLGGANFKIWLPKTVQ